MRILVVEDEPRIAADVASVLTGAGYVVETATDGEDAWFRGDTEAYDLIILDLGLPTMDGLSVLRRWRVAGRHMPVLILTARGACPRPARATATSRASMPAPTTISPNPSAWRSSSPGSAR